MIISNVPKTLLEAQKNAMFAKEAAMEAINQVYKESEASAETLAKVINEVIQCNTEKTNESNDTDIVEPDVEAEIARRNAEIAISQAKQEAMSQAADEIIKAKEEVRAAKEAAEIAIRQAKDETIKSQEQIKAANNHAQMSITLAQEKVKAISEEMEAVRWQSQIDTRQAQVEAIKAKEEAESAKKMAQEATAKAEARILWANEVMMQAQQHIINMTKDEITKTRQEIEAASKCPDTVLKKPPKAGAEANDYPSHSDEIETDDTAAILHEMRAPLHSLSGFARLMLEEDISDSITQKEFLSIIVQQSQRLHRLLDDLSGILEHNNESYIMQYISGIGFIT